jgi:tetratricopeptide (TPR) repeat protein
VFRGLEAIVGTRSFGLASRLLARGPLPPEEALERFLREDAADALEVFALAQERKAGRRRGGQRAAERWFAANLEQIADAVEGAGARLALATLGQDLADWEPAASTHRPGLDPATLARWDDLVAAGKAAEARGQCADALRSWRSALEIDDAHAALHFAVATCERRLGRPDVARRHFALASDLDPVPQGAPSRYNELLRDLAVRRGAILVDSAAALEAAAPDGLVGSELFVDFIHPNLRGHGVIALAVARA